MDLTAAKEEGGKTGCDTSEQTPGEVKERLRDAHTRGSEMYLTVRLLTSAQNTYCPHRDTREAHYGQPSLLGTAPKVQKALTAGGERGDGVTKSAEEARESQVRRREREAQ